MIKSLILFFTLIVSNLSFSSSPRYFAKKVQYRTFFGSCPSKAVGRLALTLMKEFEVEKSLLAIKKKIVDDKLNEKYFLSSYNINYSPADNMIRFQFDCPKPLLKVQIYKKSGEEFYTAILVDSGELYDPTYEVLLRGEKKLKESLPHLALPADKINGNFHKDIAHLLNIVGEDFSKRISEIILNEKDELTVILSVGRKPSSAFFGKDYWGEKMSKLQKIVSYMGGKKKIPSVINLTNSKKVVVKFKK